MSKAAIEKKLRELELVRGEPESAAAVGKLRKGLMDRSSFVVAKAAKISGELGLKELVGELAGAFERHCEDGVKSDPQCWAKNALVQALRDLEIADPDVFFRGARYQQLEPVWGGREDSAALLRGACAHGLAELTAAPSGEVLRLLVDLLADPEKLTRVNAAGAFVILNRPEGVLALRMKALAGDQEAEVTGACLSALIHLDPEESVEFARRFLDSPQEALRLEAATALSESRDGKALEILKRCWERERDPEFRRALMISIGAIRQSGAIDFLISLVTPENPGQASGALQALGLHRESEEIRARVETAVSESGSEELQGLFQRYFR